MIRRKLIQEVTVSGRNIWKRNSRITFLPAGKPGWYLRTKYGDVPIDHRIAFHHEARIQLSHGGTVVNVWEHIGALRFAGIDEVIVVVHNRWPPFLGGMRGYLPPFLKEGVTIDNGVFPTIKPKNFATYESMNHLSSKTQVSPSERLELCVKAKWGDLPWFKEHLIVDEISAELWEEIWDAKPQGWPKGRSPWFSLAIAVIKKVSGSDVAWLKDFKTPQLAGRAWGLHRVQDIFGCLSLCSHIALPILRFDSYCAGHKEDLIVTKESF